MPTDKCPKCEHKVFRHADFTGPCRECKCRGTKHNAPGGRDPFSSDGRDAVRTAGPRTQQPQAEQQKRLGDVGEILSSEAKRLFKKKQDSKKGGK